MVGMLGFLSQILKPSKVSLQRDPVHLTHVDFNKSTGEFTCLPKEWEQERDFEIRRDQDLQAAIVEYYQDIWDRMGAVHLTRNPHGKTLNDNFESPVGINRSIPPGES